MKATGQTDPIQDFYNQFTRALSTPRFVLWLMGIGFVIIVLFGALIFSIVFGLFFGFVLLALTFELPYRALRQMVGIHDLPPQLVHLPMKRIVFNCALLVMPILFIFVGVRGLQNIEFCSQALICAFGKLVAP